MELKAEEREFYEKFKEEITNIETPIEFWKFFVDKFYKDEVPNAAYSRDYFGEMYSDIVRRIMIAAWYQKFGVEGFEIVIRKPSNETIKIAPEFADDNSCIIYLKDERENQKDICREIGKLFEFGIADSTAPIEAEEDARDRRGILHTVTSETFNYFTVGLLGEIIDIVMNAPISIEEF